jgi:hypothetical protein
VRLATPRDEAPVSAMIMLGAVLMTLAVGGMDVLVLGADEHAAVAKADPTPSADEAVATLEREAQRLRQSVAALTRELRRPEVRERLGISPRPVPAR